MPEEHIRDAMLSYKEAVDREQRWREQQDEGFRLWLKSIQDCCPHSIAGLDEKSIYRCSLCGKEW